MATRTSDPRTEKAEMCGLGQNFVAKCLSRFSSRPLWNMPLLRTEIAASGSGVLMRWAGSSVRVCISKRLECGLRGRTHAAAAVFWILRAIEAAALCFLSALR
jgi:hypothetical protein